MQRNSKKVFSPSTLLFKQSGGALILFFLVMILAASATLFSVLDSNSIKIERNKKTAAALAEAKAALIGYALNSGSLSGPARPGDLPCPDMHSPGLQEGDSSTSCSPDVVGRLPWRTLNLPDLRDGNGERLWYAVSATFKKNPRAPILNSETFGTITFRDSTGTITNYGNLESAAIAVIIAPEYPLTRQDGLMQNRIAANYNDARHYLDVFDSADNSKDEDNSDFIGGGTNGFINGEIQDSMGKVILNDHVIVISNNDLLPLIERRVAKEVKNSLTGLGGLPWAVPFSNPSILGDNFFPVSSTQEGLLPTHPHYWDITGGSISHSGTVSIADLTSGFIEPGVCSQSGPQILCNSRKKIQNDTAWRNLSITVAGVLTSNSYSGNMVGSLTIMDTKISDGSVLGTGNVMPTATTLIDISPQRSPSFPEWLTENNWHHLIYYAVAVPYAYSSAIPAVCGVCLTVNYNGNPMVNIGSVILMAGKKLNETIYQPGISQLRPSGNLYDYYDTSYNQAGGAIFDWSRTFSNTFNDQLVIVAP